MDEKNEGTNIEQKIHVSDKSAKFLNVARRWAMFIAIIGFVFSGLMVIFALFIILLSGFLSRYSGFPGHMPSGLFGLLYIAIGALYFIQSLFLYKFSNSTKSALINYSSSDMEEAFKNLNNYFTFYGIMFIIGFAIFVLVIIAAVIMAIFGALLSV